MGYHTRMRIHSKVRFTPILWFLAISCAMMVLNNAISLLHCRLLIMLNWTTCVNNVMYGYILNKLWNQLLKWRFPSILIGIFLWSSNSDWLCSSQLLSEFKSQSTLKLHTTNQQGLRLYVIPSVCFPYILNMKLYIRLSKRYVTFFDTKFKERLLFLEQNGHL